MTFIHVRPGWRKRWRNGSFDFFSTTGLEVLLDTFIRSRRSSWGQAIPALITRICSSLSMNVRLGWGQYRGQQLVVEKTHGLGIPCCLFVFFLLIFGAADLYSIESSPRPCFPSSPCSSTLGSRLSRSIAEVSEDAPSSRDATDALARTPRSPYSSSYLTVRQTRRSRVERAAC